MRNETLVSVSGVTSGYGNTTVLNNVDLELREGDFMAVVGPNGGGKTTLFRTILGIVEPFKGSVTVMGLPPSKGCRGVGYVAQTGTFDMKYPVSAEDVVRMGLRQKQGFLPFGHTDKEIVESVMKSTGVIGFRKSRIGTLSGGQMQRTLLARALVSDPKVLMLDEPTASLDPEMRKGVYEILSEASSHGITVLMITHDLTEIGSMVNRVVRVDRRVSEIGGTEEFCKSCGSNMI